MDNSVGMMFMEASQCRNCGGSDRDKKLPPPLSVLPYDEKVLILLPEPDLLEDRQVNFLELVEVRSSVRSYHEKNLTLKELSYLLWCTQGVKMAMSTGKSLRNVPSAGGYHALETYLYIRQVEGLETGIYRFIPLRHALVPVDLTDETAVKIQDVFYGQRMLATCAVTFIWAAVLERMTYAYGERAYRYLHLDAGHICQNLYLSSGTIGCGTCALGHFDEEAINALLGLDGKEQFSVYAATVGK